MNIHLLNFQDLFLFMWVWVSMRTLAQVLTEASDPPMGESHLLRVLGPKTQVLCKSRVHT